jgi:hypothetical protein
MGGLKTDDVEATSVVEDELIADDDGDELGGLEVDESPG